MVSCSFSFSYPVCMICRLVLFIVVVVVDKREEKSSPIHMIVLFSLCGFCKFMTRSHTHPNWEHLHLIWYIYTFFLSNILLKLSGIMVEVENDYIPHRVLHLALAIMLLIHLLIKFLFCFCFGNYCSFAGRLYSRLIWFGIRDKSPGITLFLWYVQVSSI